MKTLRLIPFTASLLLTASCAISGPQPAGAAPDAPDGEEWVMLPAVETLSRLEEAGFMVYAIDPNGSIILAPAVMCIPTPRPSLVRDEAIKTLENRYRGGVPRKTVPPIILTDKCKPRR